MNLIIEQGNTSSKVAIYEGDTIIESFVFKGFGLSELGPVFEKYAFGAGILSTVIDVDEELVGFLRSKLSYFILLDEHVALPISIEYKTPQTLGKDRLAAVVGANYLFPGKDILVIDAGTAITYDYIDSSGSYKGGNISPGMTTRFKALHHFTKKLPLVSEPEGDLPHLGNSTESAIQAGVINGIIYEMDGYISSLRKKKKDLLVFLTGGHSFYFERRLKSSIFADINLVLTGLNRILEYNVES